MAEPDLLILGAQEARRSLLAGERRLGQWVRDHTRSSYDPYHKDLRVLFHDHFQRKTVDGEPVETWDYLALYHDHGLHKATRDLRDLTDAVVEGTEEAMEDSLDDAVVEGHRRELWLLAMGGLPAEDYADSLPEEDDRRTLLLVAGVAGISWLDRLRRWGTEAKQREEQWLRASVVGGRTLDETLQGMVGVETTFAQHVIGLAGNERHRAFGLGAQVARTAVGRDHEIAELWLTMRDGLVCPFCWALHMTVTTLKPVTDSHPACRCLTIPVPEGYSPEPIAYEDFLAELEDT